MILSDFVSFIRWAENYCLEMTEFYSKQDVNIAYTHCIATIKHIAYFSNLSQKDYMRLCLEYGYSLEKMKKYIL